MSSKTNPLPRASRILRCLILLFTIIALILLGVAYSYLGQKENYAFYADGIGPVFVVICYTAVAWSILWSTIPLGLDLWGPNYHPGVDIALDFMGFGLNFCFGGMLLWCSKNYVQGMYSCKNGSGDLYSDYNWHCKGGRTLAGLEFAGATMLLLSGCSHFGVFVTACRATHLRRTTKTKVQLFDAPSWSEVELQAK